MKKLKIDIMRHRIEEKVIERVAMGQGMNIVSWGNETKREVKIKRQKVYDYVWCLNNIWLVEKIEIKYI